MQGLCSWPGPPLSGSWWIDRVAAKARTSESYGEYEMLHLRQDRMTREG